jgi:polyisoprenoid-binding protein YceI
MSRVVKIVIAAVVLGVAAFAGIYLLFFNEDSPDEFALTPVDEQSVPADTASIAGSWTVAPGSEAGYRVREKLASLPAQSDAVGRTTDVTGTVVIDEASVTAASFEVDLTTLKSDESRRDNRVQGTLQTDQFPTATFELTSPIDLEDPTAATATVQAVGDLTIHGVTKSVTIPIEAARNGEQLELVGSIAFPMADYGITPPNVGGFVSVEPDATLEFKLVLERDQS